MAGSRKEKEEKILPKKALLRQGLHLPDQHSTSFKDITAGLANVSKSLSSFSIPAATNISFFRRLAAGGKGKDEAAIRFLPQSLTVLFLFNERLVGKKPWLHPSLAPNVCFFLS